MMAELTPEDLGILENLLDNSKSMTERLEMFVDRYRNTTSEGAMPRKHHILIANFERACQRADSVGVDIGPWRQDFRKSPGVQKRVMADKPLTDAQVAKLKVLPGEVEKLIREAS